MTSKFFSILSVIIIVIGFYFFFIGYKLLNNNIKFSSKKENDTIFIETKNKNNTINNNITSFADSKKVKKNKKINYKEIVYKVEKNKTFIQILDNFISSDKLKYEIVNKIQKIYDLRKIRTNQKIYFYSNNNDQIKQIKIPIENTVNLNVLLSDQIIVSKENLKSTIEINANDYLIKDSLYSDGIKNGVPAEILTKLIKLYSFDLDFQRDIRKNTNVSVSYELIIVEHREKKA